MSVDTAQNYVYANITNFSIFAPMGVSPDINSCTNITMPGTYTLTQDITNGAASACINITSSDVIFDGAGYIIDGMDLYGSYGVYAYNYPATLTNITVKDIRITDWDTGVFYWYVVNGSIANVTANCSINGTNLVSSSNHTLESNNVSSNDLG